MSGTWKHEGPPKRPGGADDPFLRSLPLVGQGWRFGRYSIERRLGEGGFAVVYKARDLQQDRTVALKVLRLTDGTDRSKLQLFEREAKLAKSLSHQNLVKVHELSQIDGRLFFSMELVDGVNARQYVATRGRLTVSEALHLTYQAASGISAAHEAGVIHRDLKPDNLLIATDGSLKVTDLGLGKRPGAGQTLTVSRDSIMGTPGYMPPEQFDDYSAVDKRADVYALGLILYFFLAGEDAFRPAFGDAAGQARNIPTPDVRRLRHDVPEKIVSVIAKATSKPKADRYADATRFARVLEHCLSPVRAPVGEPPTARHVGRRDVTGAFRPLGNNAFGLPEYQHGRTGIVFVELPGSNHALVGSPTGERGHRSDEEPLHEVVIPSFLIAKYPVTQHQWQAIVGSNPSRFADHGDHPVENVSQQACLEFCDRVGLDLPTEAEWEYACRANSQTATYAGALDSHVSNGLTVLDAIAWHAGNSVAIGAESVDACGWPDRLPARSSAPHRASTQPVGRKAPNQFGLYDALGNVWEWCKDSYDESFYAQERARFGDQPNVAAHDVCVARGGSWASRAHNCRAARRKPIPFGLEQSYIGFRPVCRNVPLARDAS